MTEQQILDAPAKLAEYTAVEAGLAELRQDLAGVQFDVNTTEGNKAARAARQRCVSIRTSADAAYSNWNKPMLEKQRAMRDKLNYIKEAVKEVEEPIDEQIKEHERIKAAEKAERERVEAEKQKTLQSRIDAIKYAPTECAGRSSALISEAIVKLQTVEVSLDEYGDRAGEAEVAKVTALAQLEDLRTAALSHEVEQEKLAAERAELQRQREEQARLDAEAKAKAEAEDLARKKEIEKQQAELRAQQDEIDRQKREIEAAREASEKAEKERLSKIAAEEQAKQQAKAEEDARRQHALFEQNGPGDAAIIETLALHYRVHESTVISWLAAMNLDAANKELLKELT